MIVIKQSCFVYHIRSVLQAISCIVLVLQISPASTSPRLSSSKVFPKFLRTVSSDAEVVAGIVPAMKQYGWSRIALLTQSENIFTYVSGSMVAHIYFNVNMCVYVSNLTVIYCIDWYTTKAATSCVKPTVDRRIHI